MRDHFRVPSRFYALLVIVGLGCSVSLAGSSGGAVAYIPNSSWPVDRLERDDIFVFIYESLSRSRQRLVPRLVITIFCTNDFWKFGAASCRFVAREVEGCLGGEDIELDSHGVVDL